MSFEDQLLFLNRVISDLDKESDIAKRNYSKRFSSLNVNKLLGIIGSYHQSLDGFETIVKSVYGDSHRDDCKIYQKDSDICNCGRLKLNQALDAQKHAEDLLTQICDADEKA
jgi:hypothetical protein